MIPYIVSDGFDSSIDCNADLIILNNSTPILISLVDIPIKAKKVRADLILGSSVVLRDRENRKFMQSLNTHNCKFRSKGESLGNLSHIVVLNDDIGSYCIDWDNAGAVKSITNYLRDKRYIPVSEKMIEAMLKVQEENRYSNWCRDLTVITSNPKFSNVKAYAIVVDIFLRLLSKHGTANDYKSDFDWSQVDTIEDYILEFATSVKDRLSKNIRVLYNPKNISDDIYGYRIPYDGQIPVIQATIEVLKRDRVAYLGCEQGYGKTISSLKANHAYLLGKGKENYVTLVVAPAITLPQWKKEIEECIGDDIDIKVIRKTVEFIRGYDKNPKKPIYYLVGKETFKLDSPRVPAINVNVKTVKGQRKTVERMWGRDIERILKFEETIDVACCPDCGNALQNPNRKKEDIFFVAKDFGKNPKKSNYKCSICGAVLWQHTYDKTKKTSLINYIKVKNLRFDTIIVDEVHEANNTNSIIGNATRTLFQYGNKILVLTGTSNSGYASSLHNILLGLFPRKLIADGCLIESDFITKYGTLQAVHKKDDGGYRSYGRTRIKDSDFKEVEGINPVVFTKYMAENFIFASLADLEKDLPPLVETHMPIAPLEDQDMGETRLSNDFREASRIMYKRYEDSIIRHYVNNPFTWRSIPVSKGDDVILVQPKEMSNSVNLPKEDELIKICKQEKSEGRKVWVYTDFSGESGKGQYMAGKNIPERLRGILEKEGIKVFWLRPSVSPIDRKELIEKNKDKYDVFISNPRLVQVGINLTFCPTYVVFIPSYQANVIQQAVRRGFRANSTLENRIYYLYYTNTCETTIHKRFQLKCAEARAIEGRFNVVLEDESIRTASKLGKKINSAI